MKNFQLGKLNNSILFSPAASYFKVHGVYTKIPRGTQAFMDFWKGEARKCLSGYEVDGVKITGYHYFYLNYCPIVQIDLESITEENNEPSKKRDFPRFIDGDYEYFHAVEICERNSSNLELLDILIVDIGQTQQFP